MIEKVIKERIEIAGTTQARLAEIANCTPTQLSMFLQGKGFLNQKSLETVLVTLGMDYNVYSRRMQLAKDAAAALKEKGIADISAFSKTKLARETNLPAIKLFTEVTEKGFEQILESGVIDYESTFPYFKSLVMHLMQLGEKVTPKAVESSLATLIKATPSAGIMGAGIAMAGAIIPSIGAAALIGLATSKLFEKGRTTETASNVFAPLISVAKSVVTLKP